MFRFLTAALTTRPGSWRLDGVPRLRERPIGPLIAALRQLGAEIDCPRREGYAPLESPAAACAAAAASSTRGLRASSCRRS